MSDLRSFGAFGPFMASLFRDKKKSRVFAFIYLQKKVFSLGTKIRGLLLECWTFILRQLPKVFFLMESLAPVRVIILS